MLGFTNVSSTVLRLIFLAAVVAGITFWGSEDAAHDEMVARIALAASLLVATPFIFFLKIGSVSKKRYEDLDASIDRNRYRISIEPQQVLMFDFTDGQGRSGKGVAVTLIIRNPGEHATSLTKWRGIGHFRGQKSLFPPAMLYAQTKRMILAYEDSIAERTQAPVPPGGAVPGHFMFIVPSDTTFDDLRELRLEAETADGRVMSTSLDQMNGPTTGFDHIPGMRYLKGEDFPPR